MPVKVRKRAKAQPKKAKSKGKQSQEVSAMGKIIRSLGKLGGGALGGMIGQSSAGADIGHSLGGALSRWVGFGDYSVKSNSLMNLSASGSIPNMHRNSQSVVIRHREYIGVIRGSQGFQVQYDLHINPGNPRLFPWLSKLALSYQQYNIKGMILHYVPTSGSAVSSTNAALGSVMFQTSYIAGDAKPVSKGEMMNEYWANQTVPSNTAAHPIECAASESMFKIKLVRQNEPVPVEKNLYDHGQLFIATEGMQASENVVGDLWVVYEIELKKPVVHSIHSPDVSGGRIVFQTANFAGPFSDTYVVHGSPPFSRAPLVGLDIIGHTVRIMKSGTYYFILEVWGTGLSAAAALPTLLKGNVHDGAIHDINNVVEATRSIRTFAVVCESGDSLYCVNAGAGTTITQTALYSCITQESHFAD
jgi:hypothetical protein